MFHYTCKELAEQIKEEVRKEVEGKECTLNIISNGSPEGERYIRNKVKVGTECGINVKVWNMKGREPAEVIDFICHMNTEPIIVQMPFTGNKYLDEDLISYIPAYQDADGLAPDPLVNPATAEGVFELLVKNNLIKGKHIVVIGRSNLVGRPLTNLLLDTDATVTMCHSKTENLYEITRTADVIVCAVGKRNFLTKHHIAYDRDVHVVDVGINFDEQGKLCGDVSKEVSSANCFVTPVPGGVGLLTTAVLMRNVSGLSI